MMLIVFLFSVSVTNFSFHQFLHFTGIISKSLFSSEWKLEPCTCWLSALPLSYITNPILLFIFETGAR